eukprot:401446-Pyramimonas_sp.AAC.1
MDSLAATLCATKRSAQGHEDPSAPPCWDGVAESAPNEWCDVTQSVTPPSHQKGTDPPGRGRSGVQGSRPRATLGSWAEAGDQPPAA